MKNYTKTILATVAIGLALVTAASLRAADKSKAASCCAPGAACCAPGSACCTQ